MFRLILASFSVSYLYYFVNLVYGLYLFFKGIGVGLPGIGPQPTGWLGQVPQGG